MACSWYFWTFIEVEKVKGGCPQITRIYADGFLGVAVGASGRLNNRRSNDWIILWFVSFKSSSNCSNASEALVSIVSESSGKI